ncbi:bifunctional glutamate N-acetyltransferase/amino-acid acetyltransferase ArgJ [Thermodesulforhabdus norvegica]|uniref:Arginine biosynthesis bifunctional protein ArgJ n=1 Tax=Thermodesulforhabdus norvegica TaxID=39841 RepID=A0A1I4ULZ2_9BACT|nr:bifunctional glutamate N-acetyltransferase/amino-acid acetyltransferase ArgJ [Thermodesulforhabdus norvegica]SFM89723.1 glutamate N-acetyltransferase [Thermodesulforhabdus norvegica]
MSPVPAEAAKSTSDVVVDRKPFAIPGFLVNAVETGMRYRGRPDLALILCENPEGAACGGVFTKNLFEAAPVKISREHLKESGGRVGAVLINAGIANACTGLEGLVRAKRTARLLAERLRLRETSVLVASTGVIGNHIKVETIEARIPELLSNLSPDAWDLVARAIMTTDTRPKVACAEGEIDSSIIRVGGVAKGSGMIAPNMATMLAFICTDVSIEPDTLQEILSQVTDKTFNAITVDGDTSTNDTVLVLASCHPEGAVVGKDEPKKLEFFELLLEAVCRDLAIQIVEDGEGATKTVEIRVIGAPTRDAAMAVAKTVAQSPLVKTAIYGGDANWGRVVAAAGRAGVSFDPDRLSLYFDNLCVFKDGRPLDDEEVEKRATEIFSRPRFRICLDLAAGSEEATVWTCDLTHGYIDINARYRT